VCGVGCRVRFADWGLGSGFSVDKRAGEALLPADLAGSRVGGWGGSAGAESLLLTRLPGALREPSQAPPRSPPTRHLLGDGVISGCYQLGG